jgi:hypothetical protein
MIRSSLKDPFKEKTINNYNPRRMVTKNLLTMKMRDNILTKMKKMHRILKRIISRDNHHN